MKSFYFILLVVFSNALLGQNKAMTFEQAELEGTPYEQLDKLYKSAVHSDEQLAVFKSEQDQEKLRAAYAKLLEDLGAFLRKNNFAWEKPTRCFNRIYLNKNGTVDYFLYQFLPNKEKPADSLSEAKRVEFERLLNQFVKEYTFSATAKENFAQCSSVVYKS